MSDAPVKVEIEDGYWVLDIETTVNAKSLNNKAHWAHPNNFIVACCGEYVNERCKDGKPRVLAAYAPTKDYSMKKMQIGADDCNIPRLLVGHNIKFDLLYMLKQSPNWRKEFFKHSLWDTAHVHYLLSGQRDKFPSLDSLCKQYGLPLKDNAIKDMWEAGMPTEEIPKEKLIEYCAQDVSNTHAIFLTQLEEVKKRGMEKLVLSQMDALQALIEMEFNGMAVDMDKFKKYDKELWEKIKLKEHNVVAYGSANVPQFNPNSRKDLNLLLFGGTKEYVVEVEDGVYGKTAKKAGQPKYVKKKMHGTCNGLLDPKKFPYLNKGKDGLYDLDMHTLEKIRWDKRTGHLGAIKFIDDLLTLRKLNKEYSTYVEGYLQFVYTKGDGTYMIHPNFNTTATATGRLSSSSPNMQNTSNKDMEDA